MLGPVGEEKSIQAGAHKGRPYGSHRPQPGDGYAAGFGGVTWVVEAYAYTGVTVRNPEGITDDLRGDARCLI